MKMEKMELEKAKAQLLNKSNESSISTLISEGENFVLSVYGNELTRGCVASQTVKLKSAFPSLDDGFYNLLYDQIKEMGFSDQRLVDSVNHVIRTCEYPTPTIAKFLSFDKKIKLYNYPQYQKLNDEMQMQAGKYHKAVRIEGLDKPMYASNKDILEFNLELWAV